MAGSVVESACERPLPKKANATSESRTSRLEVAPSLGGILRDLGCTAVEINSEPDHAHLLFLASRTETLSDVVCQLRTGSNLWLPEQRPELHHFH
ncbi:MAG: transposase [Prosthecobacter sp.]|nr:transposase [Prosthecobacter sp.]